jgi:hypothetical protein
MEGFGGTGVGILERFSRKLGCAALNMGCCGEGVLCSIVDRVGSIGVKG